MSNFKMNTGDIPPNQLTNIDKTFSSNDEVKPYRTSAFRKEYRMEDPNLTFPEKCKKTAGKLVSCSNKRKCLEKVLPFLRIYRKYKIRTDLPNDVIAGFTVGIMQLPQGMAYAMLADMPPVVGLYMAFFPVLIYFFFGTSRHISMGTVAVVSLMTGSVVSNIASRGSGSQSFAGLPTNNTYYNDTTGLNDTLITTPYVPTVESAKDDLIMQKLALASSMCFLVGVVQVIFGVCRLGLVTTYMSDPLVSGFTTGAAVHVFTSQVKYVFGLKIPRFPNLFQIIYTYKAIFENIAQTNYVTVIISAICMVILYIVKVHINQRFKHKLKIPVPIELLVVIAGTLLSYFFNFKTEYNVKIVGKIPAGLPEPRVPNLKSAFEYVSDAIIIAVVAFAQSVSLAALMAKKHNYAMDSNQELIAYGAGNIFGSFFSCYPFAASVSRSSVQDSAGGRTQITSIFSASLVLVVIILIGPLFECLPNCVLSSIIMVALRSMFLQILELKHLWKVSKYDCVIWVVTFLAVVILYVDLGLWVGLVFSFLTVVVRTQCTKAVSLQKIPDMEMFADDKKYVKTQTQLGIRVIGFNSPLYYANGDMFVKQVFQIVGLKPERARKQIKRLGSILEFRRVSQNTLFCGSYSHVDPQPSLTPTQSVGDHTSVSMTISNGSSGELSQRNSTADLQSNGSSIRSRNGSMKPGNGVFGYVHHVIIDCSSMCFIDSVGSKVLRQVIEEYKTVGTIVFLAAVKDEVWQVLEATGFTDKYDSQIYLSVHDAVLAATVEGEGEYGNESSKARMCTILEDNEHHVEDSLLAEYKYI
uniref:Solute carrier family 26 member 10-like isoform X1 n=1 Tax=Crassostrea virginica TaxID=6565 RepID=A0A8B8D1E0_CRAVI|nr:solute carrier family 26 member 10-like isoform X1 [Crassostrea virginica]XP_022321584.1 solute carrier family 26 member 10-like isoform X1 [Crassostrea virginica]XP_022321585.1 solute carrier family 26 member 10-like isoform X1 [Crassostrea virginica]